jgi:hypothetical protein
MTTSPTAKELLALEFAVPETTLIRITAAEAAAAHSDLTAARAAGQNPDAEATISVLVAARNALESQVIHQVA